MSELSTNLSLRLHDADEEAAAAQAAGDDFGAAVFEEIASDLRRVAEAHDVDLRGSDVVEA